MYQDNIQICKIINSLEFKSDYTSQLCNANFFTRKKEGYGTKCNGSWEI